MSPRSQALIQKAHYWRWIYISWDFAGGWLAYTSLYLLRKSVLEPARFGLQSMQWDSFYTVGAILTGLIWVCVFGIVGLYARPIRKSRLQELSQVLQIWILFSTAYFILFILDDYVKGYQAYFKSGGLFAGVLLFWTLVGRLSFGYVIRHAIKLKKYSFPTLLIGTVDSLTPIISSLQHHAEKSGERIVGWITTEKTNVKEPISGIPMLGEAVAISEHIEQLNIEDCILALPPEQHKSLTPLILDMEMLGTRIFMVPDTYGILSGMVGIDEHGVPLLEWHIEPMTSWQRNTKRLSDIVISGMAILLLSPLLLILGLLVMKDGGPAFYWQERLGRKAKPFKIVKFRSMRVHAEQTGPQLSSEEDPRITPIGRILRKYRLDELPQFWNVFIGDMSLVGPRPERAFFAEQILQKAPQYRHIYKVQPGITSWGMVRYGYASTVDQMIRRMEYDLVYIENMSFFNDIKVGIYTVWTVIQGRGK
jgi:exopolysaccharide biosynthesis polyprenyl glycosylphosphotransferase